MKKAVSIAIALLIALAPMMVQAEAQQTRLEKILAAGKIVMATAPGFPPSEFIDATKTGQDAIVGCDIELGKYIAEKLGVELVIESMDFATVLAAVSQGTVDMAISGMSPKPERAEVMEFSSPYGMDGYHGLVIHKDNLEKYKSLKDFEGQAVLAQNASLQQGLVENQVPGAKLELVTTVGDGIMMVLTGKAEAIAMSGVVAELYLKNYTDLVILDEHFEYNISGTVVGFPKGEIELRDAIDKFVVEAETTGLYAQWREEAITLAASQMVVD